MEKELIAFEDVRQLAQKMHNAGLRELEWRGADWSVRLRYPGGKTMAEPPPLPAAAEPPLLPVCSPMPGRLLLSHPSHGEAFVSEGQRVEPDDILALVQVGALYLPVRSPVTVLESLVLWSVSLSSTLPLALLPAVALFKPPASVAVPVSSTALGGSAPN